MPLRIIYKDRDVKTFKEKVAFVEKHYGSPLKPYQKLMLWVIDKYIDVKNGAEKPH